MSPATRLLASKHSKESMRINLVPLTIESLLASIAAGLLACLQESRAPKDRSRKLASKQESQSWTEW